jgi:hypothetical protein
LPHRATWNVAATAGFGENSRSGRREFWRTAQGIFGAEQGIVFDQAGQIVLCIDRLLTERLNTD